MEIPGICDEAAVIQLALFIGTRPALPPISMISRGRGYLKSGYFADVVVFDPNRYAPKSDLLHYDVRRGCGGAVVSTGKAAVDGGKMTTIRSAMPLPRTHNRHLP